MVLRRRHRNLLDCKDKMHPKNHGVLNLFRIFAPYLDYVTTKQ